MGRRVLRRDRPWGRGAVLGLLLWFSGQAAYGQPLQLGRVLPPAARVAAPLEDAEDFGKTSLDVAFKPSLFYSAALSPDEAWLVIGTNDWTRPGEVLVLSRDGKGDKVTSQRRLVRRFGLGVRTVTFSPDGRWMAAGSFSNEVWVLELPTMRTVAFWAPHASAVNDLAFSPDGKRLATASLDKTVCLWDLTPPEMPAAGLPLRAKFDGHTEAVHTVAFTPEGTAVFSGGRDKRIIVWDLEKKTSRTTWDNLPAQVECLDIAPNGEIVAVGLWNGKVEIRTVSDGAVVQTLDHLGKEAWTIGSVAFSPDGEQLVSVATDGQLKLWNWKDGSLHKTIAAHPGQIWAVQYVGNGRQIMTTGMEGVVKLWDLATGEELLQVRERDGIPETNSPMTAAAWSPNGAVLATSHADNTLRARRYYNGHSFGEVRDLPETLTRLAYSPTNDQLAGFGKGSQLYLLDAGPTAFPPDGKPLRSPAGKELRPHPPIPLTGHTGAVRDVVYAVDGASLFSVGEDGTVRHWDTLTGLPGPIRSPQQGPLRAVTCSADGRWLAAAGQSGKILLWDLHTAKLEPAAMLSGHAGPILSLVFSRRHQLASSGEDQSLRLWNLNGDVKDGWSSRMGESPSKLLTGQTQPLTRLAFSPVGGWLAADGPERITRLWKTDSGEPGPQLPATSGVLALTFNPDGMRLMRIGDDGKGTDWMGRYPKFQPIAKLDLADGVRFLAFLPDQTQVLIGTLTATVHAWDLQTGKITKAHIQEGIADGALSADGQTLATLGFSGDVALWTPQPLKLVATMKRPADIKSTENEGTALAISADGKHLAAGNWDGTVVLWDVTARKEFARLQSQELPIAGLRFSPDGSLLAVATGSWKEWQKPGTIKLWQVDSQKEVAKLPGPRSQIRRVVFSRDGGFLAAGGSQNELLRYAFVEKKWLPQPSLSTFGDNAALDFLGDSHDRLISGTSDGGVSLWGTNPRFHREAVGHRGEKSPPVSAVVSSPDGSLYATATSAGEVHFYTVTDAPPTSLGAQLATRKIPGVVTHRPSQP